MNKTNRHIILLQIIRALNGQCNPIQLQKLAYFLQEAWGVPLGYRFEMYHYGPYSFESDFVIVSDSVTEEGLEAFTEWMSGAQYADTIRIAVDVLPRDIVQLELWATIHFVDRILRERDESSLLLEKVKALKPKFTPEEIMEALWSMTIALNEAVEENERSNMVFDSTDLTEKLVDTIITLANLRSTIQHWSSLDPSIRVALEAYYDSLGVALVVGKGCRALCNLRGKT